MGDSALFRERLSDYQGRVHAMLDRALPPTSEPPLRLHEAMRYAVLGGGKRVRAILAVATGESLGAEAECMEPAACAVEFIHAYSLVHDDLPCMDDDDLRRGVPTCHRAFGEATALLVGDALQALAFETLAHAPVSDSGELVRVLARASGSRGMAGGQAIDLESVGRTLTLDQLENMHLHKTGALIRASVRLGALCAGARDPEILDRLDEYARCIGLAFQIRDDILDIEGDTEVLGKTQGADVALDKPTYPSVLGLDASRAHAHALHERASEQLAPLGRDADFLLALSEFIVDRKS
ncbi:MAG: polyprenyl synthetase family protein [Thiotrichales bacterium]|nr:polyprenyl synthetase family protein [Thiotrichales bacterium]MCY4286468.1 polyprenyl synthetase family protein [Thiotrichales bacterium]MCY4348674.1 polyprenyl synthetase family protein [Thiotrichales bacterium]